MPTTFDARADGYLATFEGPLELDEVVELHATAVERFGDGSLRWVVLDMAEAWVEPPASNGEEAAQLEVVFQMANYVSQAKTERLRLAVVTGDELTATLARLTGTAAELAPRAVPGADLQIAQFDDVAMATAWATEFER